MTDDPDRESSCAQDAAYEVGYGKPPKKNQFKKGQSGHPRGRKKGSRSRKKIVHDIAFKTQSVTINGQQVQRTTLELVLMTLNNKAMKGDIRAGNFVEMLMDEYSSRATDMLGALLVVPETLPVDEWIARARERNARVAKDIEESGTSDIIEYLKLGRRIDVDF